MADIPVFDPNKIIGDTYISLKRGELVALAKKLCDAAFTTRGDNGYRGGIRPNNVCISSDGSIVIGPAESLDAEDRTKDELEYMAPETFWNGSCSSASDVYAIGLILYAGVRGGRLPFLAKKDGEYTPDERAEAVRQRMNGNEIKAPWGSGRKLAKIIEKALAFKVEDRYEDTAAMGAALAEYLSDVPVDTAKTAKAAFGKSVDELSDVEAMMIDIIHKTVLEDDLYSEESELEETPAAEEAPAVDEAPAAEEAPAAVEAPAAEEAPEKSKRVSAVKEAKKNKDEEFDAFLKAITDVPNEKEQKKAKKSKGKKDGKKKKNTFTYIVIALAVILAAEIVAAIYFHDRDKNPAVKNTPEPTAAVETAKPTPEPTPTPTPAPKSSTYEVFVEDISWDMAEQKCAEMGGHLVCINDAKEHAMISQLLSDYNASYVWIGCYRNNNGDMTWTNGENSEFYRWAPGEPTEVDSYDGVAENYLMLIRQPDGTWLYNDNRINPLEEYSKYYSGRIAYICEIES